MLKFPRRHKRLAEYDPEAFLLLLEQLEGADLVTTPNAMTEASNLVVQGLRGSLRAEVLAALARFSELAREHYEPSRGVTEAPEYLRLGLADTAWLAVLDRETELLTVDLGLYLAALDRGLPARNFNHLRDPDARQ
ncbi:hypothetical protein [Paralimibaculum aggregatum]|uniref:hypothetical protein n=1 Tax=Paralimibaculum aggregatum TaxID=3036245 RepID=UPI002552BC58|nr:hypothetical protein [Limibaculum sp. NKW23]